MAKQKHHKKIIVLIALVVIVIGIIFFVHSSKPVAVQPAPTPVKTATPQVKPVVIQDSLYHTMTIQTTDPETELSAAIGPANIPITLEINRIDMADIKKGRVLIIPNAFDDPASLSPFPATIIAADNIPKLMVVSKAIQAFAIYESGTLVRWGGVNTGKQSTPTPSQLYYANWKGKSVVSTDDDTWVLPWYVNLDNARGISMHQYELPGYPASHACVRMLEDDAEWIYNWIDQWKVSEDGQTVLKHGTPVLVFGEYAYGKTSPWKNLAKDPAATTISQDTMESLITQFQNAILYHPT